MLFRSRSMRIVTLWREFVRQLHTLQPALTYLAHF